MGLRRQGGACCHAPFGMHGSGVRVQGPGVRIVGLGLGRVKVLGFRVYGVGVRAWGKRGRGKDLGGGASTCLASANGTDSRPARRASSHSRHERETVPHAGLCWSGLDSGLSHAVSHSRSESWPETGHAASYSRTSLPSHAGSVLHSRLAHPGLSLPRLLEGLRTTAIRLPRHSEPRFFF